MKIILVFLFLVGIFYLGSFLQSAKALVFLPPPGPKCADILVLFARGSGQNSYQDYPQFQLGEDYEDFRNSGIKEGERQTLQFFRSIKQKINPYLDTEYISLHDFNGRYNGYGYEAVTGDALSIGPNHRQDVPNRYYESVNDGVEELTWFLEDRITSCPLQQIVIGGYSQGAQVVGEAAWKLQKPFRSQIAYMAMYGDPKHNPAESRTPPPIAGWWARGNSLIISNGVLGKRDYYIADGINAAGSWCAFGDKICDSGVVFSNQPDNYLYEVMSGSSVHSNSYENFWIEQSSWEIAYELKNRLPASAGNVGNYVFINKNDKLYQLDLAVVIDISESMRDKLEVIKGRVLSTSLRLLSAYWDTRVGVVEYNTPDNIFYSKVVQPFSYDKSAIRSGISDLTANGPLRPRALYAGLHTAMSQLDWRYGAQKKIIIITDSPGAINDPSAYNVSENQILREALELDPVVLNLADVSCDEQGICDQAVAESIKNLLESSGGSISGINLSSDDTTDFEDLMSTIDTQPVAKITGQANGAVGSPLALSAGGSYDPNTSLINYRWDCNDDGVWDIEQSHPYAECLFTQTYDGLVVLEVVSEDGGRAKATIEVSISGQQNSGNVSIPQTPKASLSYGSKGVSVIWQDYPEKTILKISDMEGDVVGYVPASSKGVLLGTLGNQMAGLKIAAGSSAGWSDEADLELNQDKLALVDPDNQNSFMIIPGSKQSSDNNSPSNFVTEPEAKITIPSRFRLASFSNRNFAEESPSAERNIGANFASGYPSANVLSSEASQPVEEITGSKLNKLWFLVPIIAVMILYWFYRSRRQNN